MRSVIFHEAAEADVYEHYTYIGLDSPANARPFLRQIDSTLDLIAGSPGIGKPFESSHANHTGLRYRYIKGFPNHALFYTTNDRAITILAVLHAARSFSATLERR